MPNAVEGPHGARNYREPIDILKPRLRLTGTLPQEVCLDFRRPSGMLSLPAHTRRCRPGLFSGAPYGASRGTQTMMFFYFSPRLHVDSHFLDG